MTLTRFNQLFQQRNKRTYSPTESIKLTKDIQHLHNTINIDTKSNDNINTSYIRKYSGHKSDYEKQRRSPSSKENVNKGTWQCQTMKHQRRQNFSKTYLRQHVHVSTGNLHARNIELYCSISRVFIVVHRTETSTAPLHHNRSVCK